MDKYTRRQQGLKKAMRLVRANPRWKSQLHLLIHTRALCSCSMCKPHKMNGAKNKTKHSILKRMKANE